MLSVTVVTYSLVDTRRNLTDIRMEYGSLSHQHANVKGFFLNQYGISIITIPIREFFYSEYHCLNLLDSLIKILYRDLNNLDLNEYICDIQTKKIYISVWILKWIDKEVNYKIIYFLFILTRITCNICRLWCFVDIRRCSTVIMLQYCNATQQFSWCYRERILQYLPGVPSKCFGNVYLFNGWLRGVFEFKFKTHLFCPFFLIVSL